MQLLPSGQSNSTHWQCTVVPPVFAQACDIDCFVVSSLSTLRLICNASGGKNQLLPSACRSYVTISLVYGHSVSQPLKVDPTLISITSSSPPSLSGHDLRGIPFLALRRRSAKNSLLTSAVHLAVVKGTSRCFCRRGVTWF